MYVKYTIGIYLSSKIKWYSILILKSVSRFKYSQCLHYVHLLLQYRIYVNIILDI